MLLSKALYIIIEHHPHVGDEMGITVLNNNVNLCKKLDQKDEDFIKMICDGECPSDRDLESYSRLEIFERGLELGINSEHKPCLIYHRDFDTYFFFMTEREINDLLSNEPVHNHC